MLIRQRFLAGIQAGTISLAFRRWQRPTVRSGGTLLTAVGQLAIAKVTPVELSRITNTDAIRAGFPDRDALVAELNQRPEGSVYRIELGALVPDPRLALRSSPPTATAMAELKSKLQRLDARSNAGPWTYQTLTVIRDHPGVRAGDICTLLGQPKDAFKINVRKLKTLGLTESLEVGYRLSPRGVGLLMAGDPGTRAR